MDGRLLLKQQFQERKNRNPSYSLRAFARDLNVSVTALSQYLSRKRDFSKTNKDNILKKLQFSPLEKQAFLEQKPPTPAEYNKAILSDDLFNLIGDWISFALLSMARMNSQSAEPHVISKKLGVSTHEVTQALERLKRMKLILVKNNRLKRTDKLLSSTDDVPSQAIRKYHLSILQKAQDALQREPVERRDFVALTFPASLKNMSQIKKILRTTQSRISNLAQTTAGEDVYVVSMQFFPLTQNDHHFGGSL